MLKVKDLKRFLNNYNDEAEVILPNGAEIRHVGMAKITKDGYCVVLANSETDRID